MIVVDVLLSLAVTVVIFAYRASKRLLCTLQVVSASLLVTF